MSCRELSRPRLASIDAKSAPNDLRRRGPVEATEELHRRAARHEEIAAAADRHEILQAAQSERTGRGRDGEDPLGAGRTYRGDRIGLVDEAVERRRADPGLLEEFELALQVGADADEQDALLRRRAVLLRLVAAATPKQ